MTAASGPAVRVVTISAPYGAGGSRVGPLLAERLGWQFLDRAIPAQVAERLALPLAEALERDQTETPGTLRRLLSAMVFAGPPEGIPPAVGAELDKTDFVAATEAVVREAAAAGRVVVLGRAAAVVLGRRPDALHCRLTGPADARQALATSLGEPDADTARRRMQEVDRAREGYVRRFYSVDPADPRLYDVVLDATRLGPAACVDAIAALVRR